MSPLPPVLKQFTLEGKVALITGSSRGLGYVFAQALGEAGATVVVNGRTAESVTRAITQLQEQGISAVAKIFDVTNQTEISQSVLEIENEVGPIDVLVNNAGIQRRVPLLEASREVWEEVLATDLTAPFLVARAVAERMKRRRRGKIINICSLASFVGRKGIGPYTTAKGGLKLLTQGMCAEWAEYNIQVNGLAPGFFLTDLTRSLRENPEFNTYVESRTPAKRWGDPRELTGALLLLSSSAGDFINGQLIVVDGGILATM